MLFRPDLTRIYIQQFIEGMKVLVTGGAGYLGSILVPMLLKKGHDVTVYDTLRWGVNSLIHVANNSRLRIVKGDIKDRKHIADEISLQDAIIHLAAIVGYPACDANPDSALDTNISGTRNIAEFKSSNQILIYACTGSCYGAIDGNCTENTKLNPLTLYGKSKASGEEIIRSVGGISLRLATLFGLSTRMRLDLLVNDLTYKAFECKNIELYEGDFRRTFLHVRDAAEAFIFALENEQNMSGEAYNVGDENLNMTKYNVAQIIQKLIPDCSITQTYSTHDKDKRDYEVSYKKINDLGYRNKISIEEGIREMLRVFPFLSVGEPLQYCNI
ncbi:GDP-D-glycero-alpha-D-manno-heptose dehydrogenase-like [Mercenaria mercenaria]|uniref:GDP-D-glycero-alpha-D-manno-heptose dehydrogenase-like n=1 Tax=Mercenaria mercenaria TaxID=6596 RepID=UPI001E1DC8FE|nr:GDP-D-glycero-alpha-D-manno-heptose dehydrogenase-like [Mercenaria mercenaria]